MKGTRPTNKKSGQHQKTDTSAIVSEQSKGQGSMDSGGGQSRVSGSKYTATDDDVFVLAAESPEIIHHELEWTADTTIPERCM